MVDDRPANLLALEAVLEPLALRLVRATSGAEALERIQAEDVAVVLLDVQMPGMDGFETAQRIRASGTRRNVPIIFLTAGDHDPKAILRAHTLGAVDLLIKPLASRVSSSNLTPPTPLSLAGEGGDGIEFQ